MLAAPASRPAAGYDEAIVRAKAFMALDDAEDLLPEARTTLLDRGRRAPLAVVLLHGITNNPAQYSEFAPMLRERGANVFIPRMPFHGYRDRLTTAIAKLTSEMLLQTTSEALDVAAGLGERVAVLGISMGGLLAAYFGQHREIALAVPVAPDFALLQLPYGASKIVGRIVRTLPNFFFWWDPRVRARMHPLTAYPRCSTHALGQSLHIGDDVYAAAIKERQKAERIVTVVNRCDPAVNNEVTAQVVQEWAGWRRDGAPLVEFRNLPENHDIVDPRNPLARTSLVYPKLLEALGL